MSTADSLAFGIQACLDCQEFLTSFDYSNLLSGSTVLVLCGLFRKFELRRIRTGKGPFKIKFPRFRK